MAFNLEGSTDGTVAADNVEHDITLPGTPIEGDLTLYQASSDQALDPGITSSGWTTIHSTTTGSSPGYTSAFKMQGASPDTVIGITQAADDQPVAILATWSGVDTTTPFEAKSGVATSGTGMPDAGLVTLAAPPDNLVIAMGNLDDDEVAGSVTVPIGFSDLIVTDGGACFLDTPSTTDSTTMMASIKDVGSTDPAAFGGSGTDAWKAWSIGFNPLAAGGATPKGPFGMPFARPFAGPFG